MAHDNAASRLLQLLKTVKSIDPNLQSIRAWEQLLNTKKNPGQLLSRMGKMMALPAHISASLSNTVGMKPEILQHISQQFYVALTTHTFNGKWQDFSSRIDSHMLNYLDLASTLMEMQTKTDQLGSEEIDKLRSGFIDVLERARDADISPRLKSYVVSQLHDLLAALDDYFITGAEPILERVEATIGHAYVDAEYQGFLKDHELGKSFLDCLSAAANLVTVAVGIPQLTTLVSLLQHGG